MSFLLARRGLDTVAEDAVGKTPFPCTSHRKSDLSKLDFSNWPIWPAQEAFGDPKSPGNKPSNEGHGFSRAVNSRA
jgi:hypothetical protein